MSGTQHYREAERLLVEFETVPADQWSEAPELMLAAAQVHATLALTAATAFPAVRQYWGDDTCTAQAWAGVAS